jgi:hypothetical protein
MFVVTPVTLQRAMVGEIIHHWTDGEGTKKNHLRAEALGRVTAVASVRNACAVIQEKTGFYPHLVATSAKEKKPNLSFFELRTRIEQESQSYLLLLGTGWGLAPELMAQASYRLPAIHVAPSFQKGATYNHLSVRAATAIMLDRIFGQRP